MDDKEKLNLLTNKILDKMIEEVDLLNEKGDDGKIKTTYEDDKIVADTLYNLSCTFVNLCHYAQFAN